MSAAKPSSTSSARTHEREMNAKINPTLPVSHVAKDVSHRCDNASDVALNCREWATSLRQELHPASPTLFAAATMIDSQAEEIARLRWELNAARLEILRAKYDNPEIGCLG